MQRVGFERRKGRDETMKSDRKNERRRRELNARIKEKTGGKKNKRTDRRRDEIEQRKKRR